eukprot:TRINITY_DN1874_c0_g1_i1.p1 TRINITY_DN1874_c0_g1~~TRINITY_DN1874_c0_g1_i1.p1  ORF type:complete len:1354 (-),score=489.30 TRINITY_DN1874_c0_g1_i1:93-4154(-)
MVDLSEAAKRVEVLEKFPFEDDQPNIEGPVISVLLDSSVDFRFADKAAFDSRWSEELVYISQLKDLIKQGDFFVNLLYTYRSISKALRVKPGDESNKNEMYEKMYEVLEPEIDKLKKLMYFHQTAIKAFSEHVKRIAGLLKVDKKKEAETFPSQLYLWHVIQVLDRFALLDDLKNMKACLNNDFAFYKRAFQFLRKTISGNDDQNSENHNLYLFLAHQNSITSNLKIALQSIPGYDDVISETINCAADLLDSETHMLPNEKYSLLRIMPFGLILMDGDQNTGGNVFKTKKVKMNRIANVFKRFPVVPLYGDMQITLENVIRRSPHFAEATWATTASTDAKQAEEYELIHHLESVRIQYNEYVAKFANMINELKSTKRDPKQAPFSPREVYTMVLQGLLYLSDWSGKILGQAAWKYAKPNNDPNLVDVDNYERVVRHNYKPEEKFALVEFLAMVKTLATLITREDSLLSPLLRTSIHQEVQEFVQSQIRDAIRTTVKKKRTVSKTDLLNIRSIGADWYGGLENNNDPVLTGKKPPKDERTQLPTRATPPSPTQLALLRMITFGLLNSKKHDWKDGVNKQMETFYNRSYFFDYLLNLSSTILQMTDMGDLWYREFYLELGKKLQFPIDMSLPWILTDNILETKDPSMMEFLFYPLDIYNDSANRALKNLNKQFLYDEVEAEVNLCFDQLVYKLSEQLYTFYKTQASSILMDKAYKGELETFYTGSKLQVPKSRYDVIVKQRHIQLLGRSIDLNLLISQRMNTYLRQNIDYAIARFEASDLTGIMELESLLSNIQLTYFLMAEYYSLDPWEDILAESNERVSLVSFHGRIVLHIIFELMYDFAPNYNFNSITNRFVRTPRTFVEKVVRESMPKLNPLFLYGSKTFNGAYANSAELWKNFIGVPHVSAIVKLVGATDLPLIVSECLQNMDLKIRNVLAPYVSEAFKGLYRSSKLPPHAYKTVGGHGYYESILKDLKSYPELQSELLRNFKEVGNWIIFLNMCELALSQHELGTFRIAAPFLGATSDPATFVLNADAAANSPLYSAIHNLVQFLEGRTTMSKAPEALKEMVANAWRADRMYRPTPQNFSLFKAVLRRISQMLESVRFEWSGGSQQSEKGVLLVDQTAEFYRLWSAILFISCSKIDEGETMTNHELFGDGLFWAGATMIHFLGQKHRFLALDFNLHILNLAESLQDIPPNNTELPLFLAKATLLKDLNNSIFHVLNTYAPPNKKEPTAFAAPEKDTNFAQFVTAASSSNLAGKGTMRPVSTFISAPPTGSSGSFDGAPSFNPPPVPNERPVPPPPSYDYDAPPPPPSDDLDYPPPPPDDFDAPPPPFEEDYDAPPPPPDDFPPPPPDDY